MELTTPTPNPTKKYPYNLRLFAWWAYLLVAWGIINILLYQSFRIVGTMFVYFFKRFIVFGPFNFIPHPSLLGIAPKPALLTSGIFTIFLIASFFVENKSPETGIFSFLRKPVAKIILNLLILFVFAYLENVLPYLS